MPPNEEARQFGKSSSTYKVVRDETGIGLSVVSVAELVHGAYRARTDNDRQRRLAFIEEFCRDVPVYPVTIEIAQLAGRIEAELEVKGVRVAFEDLLIGATALHLGWSVATLNVRHFELIPSLSLVHL